MYFTISPLSVRFFYYLFFFSVTMFDQNVLIQFKQKTYNDLRVGNRNEYIMSF